MSRLLTALALAVAALAAGCGADEEEEAPAATGTELTVVVHPEGEGGPAERRAIECPGAPECERLPQADFAPVPPDVACTQIYGGDATAQVTGTIEGQAVDASFSLTNGCEIARWERLSWLLGEPPGVVP